MSYCNFNSWSFFTGMLVGVIIRWTDLLPITFGFVIGLTVRHIPHLINLNDFPMTVQNYMLKFKTLINENDSENSPSTPILNLNKPKRNK